MFSTRHAPRFAVLLSTFALLVGRLQAADDQKTPQQMEQELLALLRSDAPKADKAIACKKLAVYGGSQAVPDLARLLSDEQLASWARIALEAIPGSAADEALRNSLDSLDGKLLVGAINSVGVRRDAGAVERLTARLKADDAEVASAAAVALGHVANDPATSTLRKTLPSASAKLRSAVAEGLVLCAEKRLEDGRTAEAIEIFDEVRKAEVPKQRKLEATRGAILARKEKGFPLLIEQLHSSDKVFFQLALGTARELPAGQVDQALAAELSRTAPDRAALVVEAMADRKDGVVLPAVLKAAEGGPKEIRLAALAALGRVGDASCLEPLLHSALESDPDLAQTSKAALAELRGETVDREIVSRLGQSHGPIYRVLIELVGKRRIDAVPPLVKALDQDDQAVRAAALASLGETVSPKDLSVLIKQVVAPKHSEDATVALQALKAASVRMPDREACAVELNKALEAAGAPAKKVLLDILAAVGGTKALAAVGTAAKSDDADLKDVSSRLLGEWMTADAAPVLLDLAKTGPSDKFQVRALRGYVRIARQFVLPEAERMEMCQKALDACRTPAEQKLVLEVLKRYPTEPGLKLALRVLQVPELKDDATQTALAIAQKLPGKADVVRDLLSQAGLERVKLEIVKAQYGAGNTQKDVTEALKKQASDVPMITLASANYNEAFGGDPVPGTVKQLKVQYKINGKAGEASFAENAVILLPMPK
ncbi:MAG TPA: HEAT repeat domain-containing protein [Pirellulales bacterium]|nr:HEAT repeat domain-containing protein [Pirellulales bacterium]